LSAARLTVILILFASRQPPPSFAQSDAVSELLGRINALRRQNGLAPLELHDALNAAAQRHAQDMGNTGNVDHAGSDGSTPEQRLDAAGYAPRHTWGENIYGGGIATVDDAWTFWTNSTVHRNNLLSERYREIGIGAAVGANGTYYTLTFGARPGVLPFFVDQGTVLDSPAVTLTLCNEEAEPAGSRETMGRAVEIRAGEGEDLSAVAWQPWQRTISFTLSSVDGDHRIRVEYRDANGVVASYFRLVTLTGAAAPSTATPTTPPTVQPTSAHTATPAPTETPTPVPTNTPAPSATSTPLPSATFTPTPVVPTVTKTPPIVALRSDQPATDTPPTVAVFTMRAAPATPDEAPADESALEALVARGWSDAPADLLGLIALLSILAVVIGASIVIHRSTKL
jgi:hypothetical protein